MLRLAFDFIITWRETRTRPNAYDKLHSPSRPECNRQHCNTQNGNGTNFLQPRHDVSVEATIL